MMADNSDLGLSLSLTTPNTTKNTTNHHHHLPLQLNLMSPSLFPSSSSSCSSSSLPHTNLPFLLPFPSTVDRTPRSFLSGIDVNRVAEDDEPGASSPNSTVSSVSGKRSEREIAIGDDLDLDDDDGDTSRKKLRLSKDQSAVLEESFKEHNTLNPKQKLALSKRLGLRPRQVEVWFQNRRARTKLKQTEVDCEFLKRCCEQLTDENRRLQKEVQELRQLKLSPQFYMQMTPPTTLTMCPSCERVAVPASGSAPVAGDSRSGHRGFPVNPWAVGGLRPRP